MKLFYIEQVQISIIIHLNLLQVQLLAEELLRPKALWGALGTQLCHYPTAAAFYCRDLQSREACDWRSALLPCTCQRWRNSRTSHVQLAGHGDVMCRHPSECQMAVCVS